MTGGGQPTGPERARKPYPGALGAVLAAGGMFGAIEVLLLPTPPSVLPWLVACNVAMAATAMLWIFQAHTRHRLPRSVFLAVFFGLGVALTWLMAWTDGRTVWVLMLLLPIVGGLELQRVGAVVGTVVGVPGILVNAVLAATVWELDVDPLGVAGEIAALLGVGWLCVIWSHRVQYYRARALQRQAEAADRRFRAAVAERDRELGELRGSVIDATNQPFRQPLRAVHEVTLDLLHPALAGDEARSALDRIEQQAAELNQLVRDLKTLQDLDGERLRLRAEPCSLAVVVRRATTAVPPTQVATTGHDVVVQADPDALAEAVRHVVDNAVRHGGDRVDVHWNRRGATVDLVVSDDGPGIDPADADEVFQPFVQLGTAAARHPGRGLGLPLARGLLRAMDGDVVVEPAAAGARVRFRIPATGTDAEWSGPRRAADDR